MLVQFAEKNTALVKISICTSMHRSLHGSLQDIVCSISQIYYHFSIYNASMMGDGTAGNFSNTVGLASASYITLYLFFRHRIDIMWKTHLLCPDTVIPCDGIWQYWHDFMLWRWTYSWRYLASFKYVLWQ